MKPRQLRSARALLGWTQVELAQKAGIGLMSLKRLEAGEAEASARLGGALLGVLEAAGVVMVEDEQVVGVVLRKAEDR